LTCKAIIRGQPKSSPQNTPQQAFNRKKKRAKRRKISEKGRMTRLVEKHMYTAQEVVIK